MTCSILNQIGEEGVSETISAVLLVGLTVIGLALISVILFSQPLAEGLPAADIIVSNTSSTILFFHHGGDPFGKDDFTIFVNGEAVDPDNLGIEYTGDRNWPWSVGETLNYSYSLGTKKLSDNIRIVHGKSGSGSVIRPAFVDNTGNSGSSGGFVPKPTPDFAEAGVIVAESILDDAKNIVVFPALDKIEILGGKNFNFTIQSPNSRINIEGKAPPTLKQGTRVSIRTGPTGNNFISITGVGKTFFSLRFENVYLSINETPFDTNVINITSGWIPEYSNLNSDLSFTLKPTSVLYVNEVPDPRGNSIINLNHVTATNSGMFVINPLTPENTTNCIILANAELIQS